MIARLSELRPGLLDDDSVRNGIVNDTVAIYFFNAELARAFVNRWRIGFCYE
jgi:hypothetical protein